MEALLAVSMAKMEKLTAIMESKFAKGMQK